MKNKVNYKWEKSYVEQSNLQKGEVLCRTKSFTNERSLNVVQKYLQMGKVLCRTKSFTNGRSLM